MSRKPLVVNDRSELMAPGRGISGAGQLLPVATLARLPGTSRSGSVEAWLAIEEHHSRSIDLPPLSVAGESVAVRPRRLAVVIAARIQL